jgi:hypothetical protein
MKKKMWFKKAVYKRPPYSLGGWKKTQSPSVRRSKALSSRPKNWTMKHRYLSAGRALQALANVTKDKATKQKAHADAMYFFSKL